MTELSFNEQSNQVSNDTKVEDTTSSEDEGYSEKHVRINDEDLPVVYKPKSYSQITDDTNYEHIIHQHPALKFSTSSSHIDMNNFFSSKQCKMSNSPFLQRKTKLFGGDNISISSSSSPKVTKKRDIARRRGKTFPPYTDVYHVTEEKSTTENNEKTAARSSNNQSPKWFHFFKRINVLSKFHRNRSKSRQKSGSFHDLPPIRVCLSMDNLDFADEEETNNNNELDDNESHMFTQTKSYRPVSECMRHSKLAKDCYKNKNVSLKRVNSLPIL